MNTKDMSGLRNRFPREYNSFRSIKNRCLCKTNKGYPKWGGRGIEVCDRWLERPNGFKNFLKDMGPKPDYSTFPSGYPRYTIDRIDNDGPYSPDNCRWATAKEQVYNRSNTRYFAYNNELHTLLEWSKILGIPLWTLYDRLKKGKTGNSLFAPVDRIKSECGKKGAKAFMKK